MYNYPNFLNLFTTFMYIPFSFAYIIPMLRYGNSITPEQTSIPKRVFAVMGALDGLSGIMQIFASTYLGGSLIILLTQVKRNRAPCLNVRPQLGFLCLNVANLLLTRRRLFFTIAIDQPTSRATGLIRRGVLDIDIHRTPAPTAELSRPQSY